MKTENLKIEYSNDLILTNNIPVDCILGIEGISIRDMYNGYIWYSLPDIESNGYFLRFKLCFHQNRINYINFKATTQKMESWDNWSEESEIKAVSSTKNWLESQGYMVGSYPWGRIDIRFDSKSGSGSGTISFVDSQK